MTERQKQILAELEAYLMPGYVEPYTTPDHDATHPQRMCLIANKIAGDEINLFLLQTTIWFHNLDRSTYPFTEGDRTSHEYIPRVIRGFTSRYPDIFSHKDQDVIVDTVEKHDRLNAPDDSPVTVYLKDCDRLDGMGAIGLVRTVDYARKRKLPLYTPSDFDNIPDSTDTSTLRSFINNLQRGIAWGPMLRVPKAKELAKNRLVLMEFFLTRFAEELRELDVL